VKRGMRNDERVTRNEVRVKTESVLAERVEKVYKDGGRSELDVEGRRG
jgi:hypothetical protein